MTWHRTSSPGSSRTVYACGDYTITGIDESFRSGRWFHVTCMGVFIDVCSTLSLAKRAADDHFNGL